MVSSLTYAVRIGMYEDLKEYLNWYDTRRDTKFAADAPVIGLVLQRSHLVTGDEGHYSGVVSELEAQGAKVGKPVQACRNTGLTVEGPTVQAYVVQG